MITYIYSDYFSLKKKGGSEIYRKTIRASKRLACVQNISNC